MNLTFYHPRNLFTSFAKFIQQAHTPRPKLSLKNVFAVTFRAQLFSASVESWHNRLFFPFPHPPSSSECRHLLNAKEDFLTYLHIYIKFRIYDYHIIAWWNYVLVITSTLCSSLHYNLSSNACTPQYRLSQKRGGGCWNVFPSKNFSFYGFELHWFSNLD